MLLFQKSNHLNYLLLYLFQNKLYTDKIKDFVSNNDALLLLSLVKDLFEYLGLTRTTFVFDPETGAGHYYQYKDKNEIFQELSLSQGNIC